MLSRAYAPIISLPAARGRLVTYSLFTRWTRCEIRSAEVAVEEKPRQNGGEKARSPSQPPKKKHRNN